VESEQNPVGGLIPALRSVNDPRIDRSKLYPLIEILFLELVQILILRLAISLVDRFTSFVLGNLNHLRPALLSEKKIFRSAQVLFQALRQKPARLVYR
jgi:hypothetical protein